MAVEDSMAIDGDASPGTTHDDDNSLWQLADAATNQIADEEDGERTKRVQAVYAGMATRAKEMGCRVESAKKQRTD